MPLVRVGKERTRTPPLPSRNLPLGSLFTTFPQSWVSDQVVNYLCLEAIITRRDNKELIRNQKEHEVSYSRVSQKWNYLPSLAQLFFFNVTTVRHFRTPRDKDGPKNMIMALAPTKWRAKKYPDTNPHCSCLPKMHFFSQTAQGPWFAGRGGHYLRKGHCNSRSRRPFQMRYSGS